MAKQDITKMNTQQLVAYGHSWLKSNRVKYGQVSANDVRFVKTILEQYNQYQMLSQKQHNSLLTTMWIK